MTSKIYLIFSLFFLAACSANKPVVSSVNKTTPSLDDMISEMVMVGFREAEIDENTPIYHILKNGYAVSPMIRTELEVGATREIRS